MILYMQMDASATTSGQKNIFFPKSSSINVEKKNVTKTL